MAYTVEENVQPIIITEMLLVVLIQLVQRDATQLSMILFIMYDRAQRNFPVDHLMPQEIVYQGAVRHLHLPLRGAG